MEISYNPQHEPFQKWFEVTSYTVKTVDFGLELNFIMLSGANLTSRMWNSLLLFIPGQVERKLNFENNNCSVLYNHPNYWCVIYVMNTI